MLMFDNRLSLIGVEVVKNDEFGLGFRSTKPMIAAALLRGASGILLAHNHIYGPDYPSEGDYEVTKWLKEECEKAGLALFEHYIVCGKHVRPILHNLPAGAFAEDIPWQELLDAIEEGIVND